MTDPADVLRLYFRGLTHAQIATELHVSVHSVRIMMARRGLRNNGRGQSGTRAHPQSTWTNSNMVDPDWDTLGIAA